MRLLLTPSVWSQWWLSRLMALFSHHFLPCSLSSDPRPNSGRASPGSTTSTVTSTSCAPVHPWRPTSLRTRRREPPHRHSRHRAEAPRPHGSSTRLPGGHLRGEGKRENNAYGLILGQFTKYYSLLLFSHTSAGVRFVIDEMWRWHLPPNVEPRMASHSPELRLTGDWWAWQSVRSTTGLRPVSSHSLLTGGQLSEWTKGATFFLPGGKTKCTLRYRGWSGTWNTVLFKYG